MIHPLNKNFIVAVRASGAPRKDGDARANRCTDGGGLGRSLRAASWDGAEVRNVDGGLRVRHDRLGDKNSSPEMRRSRQVPAATRIGVNRQPLHSAPR
jgi:hypothetical protein